MNNHRFGIGFVVEFGTIVMVVREYRKLAGQWAVLFQGVNNPSLTKAIPCKDLENV